jgi:hypothetical protein
MAIIFRAAGIDSNGSSASPFCALPVPIGTTNGDVAIVAIAIPTGVNISPPDASWNLIIQTDPAQFGLVAYWKICLNEQTNWSFALSSAAVVAASCLVYGNTDMFVPVEVAATQLTAASTTHGVAGATASQLGEELALFMAGANSGTYTPASGFTEVARKQQSSVTIEAQHKGLQSAGPVASFSEAFTANAAGASLLLVIAPGYGTLSSADAYGRIFGAMPPGIDDLLNFTSGTGDFWKFFNVLAMVFKLFVFDLYDLAKQEIVPYLSRYKLPDWERFFGLQSTNITQFGTIPQRQQQVLSAWRAAFAKSGSFTTLQAVMGPLLGYLPSTAVRIIEADRSALTLAHSYDFCAGVDVALNQGTTTTLSVYVNDGGAVGAMGAQVTLTFSSADTTTMVFVLTGPDGTSKTWAAGSATSPLWLTAPEFAGAQIQGAWTLAITNNSPAMGSYNTLYSSQQLFVEGMGPRQQTGGAVFDWGVYVDPSHIGENGNGADFASVRNMLRKIAFDHTTANVIQSLAPYPNTSAGVHCSIPDECIPT